MDWQTYLQPLTSLKVKTALPLASTLPSGKLSSSDFLQNCKEWEIYESESIFYGVSATLDQYASSTT